MAFTEQQVADMRRRHLLDTADIYPVGWLSALQYAYRAARRGRWQAAAGRLRQEAAMSWSEARDRRWRSLKNGFNGYLAEIEDHNAGHGWTRKRALRSLDRIIREANR